jgi:hypothetical protein
MLITISMHESLVDAYENGDGSSGEEEYPMRDSKHINLADCCMCGTDMFILRALSAHIRAQ